MACPFCYANNPCNHCLHLEFYELENPRRHDSTWTWSTRDAPKSSVRSVKSTPFGFGVVRDDYSIRPVEWLFDLKKIAQNASSCEFCNIIHQAAKLFLSGSLKQVGYELQDTLYLQKVDVTVPKKLRKSGPRLQFFASGSGAAPTAIGRDLARILPQFWSPDSQRHILSWLGDPSPASELPKRVLDLGIGDDPSSVRLWETGGRPGTYATLSHCWIGRRVKTTTRSNLAKRRKKIELSSLSPLFQDAMGICRFLGVQCLWIDSLCILQGDSDDWEDQAARMDVIYGNSLFTIAVHDDSESGFIPLQGTHLVRAATSSEAAIYVRDINNTPRLLRDDDASGWRPDDKPNRIHQRGWCYQERLLSRRILHFVESEVIYESDEGITCQCGDHSAFAWHRLQGSRYVGWAAIVESYTQLYFTKPWDLLPGIAGIARRYRNLNQSGNYIAGLWSNNLASWLCWQSVPDKYGSYGDQGHSRGVSCTCSLKSHAAKCKRLPSPPSRRFMVPSFSWASRFGPCEFIHLRGYTQTVRIAEIQHTADPKSPFGRVNHSLLRLEAKAKHFFIYSTFDKTTKMGFNKYAYACDENLHERLHRGLRRAAEAEDAVERLQEDGYRIALDVANEYPPDGTKVLAIEMFNDKANSVVLLLWKKGLFTNGYRRLGLCFVDLSYFPDSCCYEPVTIL